MVNSGEYIFLSGNANRKVCKVCNREVDAKSRRRSYCSKRCADEAKLRIDRRRSLLRRGEKVAAERHRANGCTCHQPSFPHRFDENMVCQECFITWEDNQSPPTSGLFHPCTPDGEFRAVKERDHRERMKAERLERKRAKREQASGQS